MFKFENIDLLDALEKIMLINTKHYVSDFSIDKKILIEAAKKKQNSETADNIYLWLSRPCGTWCFREWKVFLKNSPE